jgi:hypothetical protein
MPVVRVPESGLLPGVEESLHRVLVTEVERREDAGEPKPTVNTEASSLPEGFRPSKRALLDALVRAREAQTKAEIDQVALVSGLCDAYEALESRAERDTEGSMRTNFGEKRFLPPGWDVSGRITEFVTLELGPALKLSPLNAYELVGDVLWLRCRFPITWNQVLCGRVPVWLARKIVGRCRSLSAQACGELDARIGPLLPGWGPVKTMREVDRWRMLLDPDLEKKRQERKKAGQVRVDPDAEVPGRSWLTANLCSLATKDLMATIDRLAATLRKGGQAGDRDALRAQALQHLAHPERAARLLQDDLFEAGADITRDGHIVNATTGEMVTRTTNPGAQCSHGATLVVHLRAEELVRGAGGEIDGIGPITAEHLTELLTACAGRVVVRPVVDLAEPMACAAYQPSPEIAWRVKMRDRTEIFPYSERSAFHRMDLDHTIAHGQAGGVTCTSNLGPLSRRVHRAKTHAGFTVTQQEPGVFHWVTPLGRQYWTNCHGTFTEPPPAMVMNQPDQTTIAVLARMLQAAAAEAHQARAQELPNRDPGTGQIITPTPAPPPPF